MSAGRVEDHYRLAEPLQSGRQRRGVPALNSLAVKYHEGNFPKIHYSGATPTTNTYQAPLRSAMSMAGI
jgi:hypothetical protein